MPFCSSRPITLPRGGGRWQGGVGGCYSQGLLAEGGHDHPSCRAGVPLPLATAMHDWGLQRLGDLLDDRAPVCLMMARRGWEAPHTFFTHAAIVASAHLLQRRWCWI